MHKKEDRFILDSLEIPQIEQDRPSQTQSGLVQSMQRLVDNSNFPIALTAAAHVINLLSLLGIVMSYDISEQWNFPATTFVQTLLSCLRNTVFVRGKYDTITVILCSVIFIHHTLLLLYLGFLNRFFEQRTQESICKYITFFLLILNQSFGVFFYTFFGAWITCPDFVYDSVCLSGPAYFYFIVSIIVLIEQVIFDAIVVLLLHFSNPAIPTYRNGSSVTYLGILHIERIAYSLYFVIKQNTLADKQFLVFMTIAAVIKIYEKLQTGPFFDTRYQRLIMTLDGCLEMFVAEVCLITFIEVNQTNPISFVIILMTSVCFGYCFSRMLEDRYFKSFELLAKTQEKFEQELALYSTKFIAAVVNVPHGMSQRKTLENLVYVHRLKCRESTCTCSEFQKYDFKQRPAEKIQRDCFRFWNTRLRAHLTTYTTNTQFLIQSMFLSIYHTNKIFSVLVNYRKADTVKKEINQVYELALIRNLLRQKIVSDNFEFVKQFERINYTKLRENHLKSVAAMREIELILRLLFNFWEDLTVVPQKFEKNYGVLFEISRRMLELKAKLEEFSGEHLNTKLIKTFVAFAEMTGFPAQELKRTFYKIIMAHEQEFEKSFMNVRIRSTVVSSRKTAILVMSASRESIGDILYASSLCQEVLNYHACQLRGKNISSLMPLCYSQVHNKMVETYMESTEEKKLKSRNIIGTVVDGLGFMHKICFFVKIYPYCDTQIKMVSSSDCVHEAR